jgi:hypothetical protein
MNAGDNQVAGIRVLIDQIDRFTENRSEIPQADKDQLILAVSKMVLLMIEEHSKRLVFLEKYKPYLQVLAWTMAIVAGSLITMAVSGHLSITVIP